MKASQFPSVLAKTTLVSAAAALLTASAGAAGLSLDTSRRDQARVFYNAVYPASENIGMSFTGNFASGNPGTTSYTYKQAVYLRVNFFRAFAGIPADITHNTSWSSMDQSAALMMSANSALDHTPPSSWRFYTSEGATAAGRSNLSLSTAGPDAIVSYMEDAGDTNAPVGHRRWILFPQTQQMGTGDVPANGSNYAANALWTLDMDHYANARPAVRDGFVSWPPKGYVPYQMIYPRWSFSYPDADFSGARVTVSRNNVSLPVSIASRTQGYGENTLVFVPNNQNPDAWSGPVKPTADTRYTVQVSNVSVGGNPQNFSYDVIVFDPAKTGGDTPNFAISGSATPKGGATNTYSVTAQTLATGYQWKYSTKAPYTTVVGAESSAGVTARVPGGYNFRDKKVRAVGNYSYHLTHPNFTESSFSLRDSVLCSTSTKLTFKSRLAYSTNYQSATVEVSTDGGNQWVPVWTQDGRNNAGESAFATRTVPLRAFAGREVKIRFRFALRQGSAYTQTDQGVGWYVDNIAFSRGERLLGTKYSGTAATPQFSFRPVKGQSYVLQVRAQVLGEYYGDWSGAKTVTAR